MMCLKRIRYRGDQVSERRFPSRPQVALESGYRNRRCGLQPPLRLFGKICMSGGATPPTEVGPLKVISGRGSTVGSGADFCHLSTVCSGATGSVPPPRAFPTAVNIDDSAIVDRCFSCDV